MLSNEAQQSLPQDAQVALQQVDNRALLNTTFLVSPANLRAVKYFLISAPVDWTPDQYIRRFLLPTGEYVSCVLWYVESRCRRGLVLTRSQEQPLSHFWHRHCAVSFFQISSVWTTGEELEEVRGGYILRPAKPQVGHRCVVGGAKECFLGFPIQEQLHPNTKEAEGLLLVQRAT